jgi:hypothetical protein
MTHHSREILKTIATDYDMDAKVIRIQDTGAKDTNYPLVHELGRVPVGCQIILADKDVRFYKGTRWNNQTVDLKFTADNADVNLQDINGNVPLIYAFQEKNQQIYNIIYEKFDNFNAINLNGRTVLHNILYD